MMRAVLVLAAGLLVACSDPSGSPSDGPLEVGLVADLGPAPETDLSSSPDVVPGDQGLDAAVGPVPVWLLHITDLHLGASSYADEALKTAIEHIVPVVSPAATLVTGDITDGGDGAEWSDYLAAIQGKVAPYPLHLEIVGNHDKKGDGKGFFTGTQTGLAGGGAYGLSYVDAAPGRIELVRTDTVDSTKALEQLLGYVGETQVKDLQALPPSAVPIWRSVVLGHHPIDGVQGLKVLGTDKRLEQLLTHFAAEVYLCGHAHLSHLSWNKTTLVVQGPTLGKPEIAAPNPGFALVALDEEGPAARIFGLTKSSPAAVGWPLVLTTAPADAGLGGTNPRAKPITPGQATLTVRALGFSPSGIVAAEARVDGGGWLALNGANRPLWQGSVPVPAPGKHTLDVRVLATEGSGTHTTSFSVGP